ncbi:C6 finger domain protein [Aspergillus nomiae NRRL 13137]|uniref:C6 finger domain protein n=1 Tax=Aspergillus nomiae NRRL (strain ATCC 15546 / NRRL 13137 / CBS 260.88 / M93) TaxID=1509407 RepID=A0A0L1JHU8_ASPN3|nr:C6 finger domain protein [Aspergillus nomiae NRRL 13137]KNG90943.1 C6 finger domain protein [Aspergillus nomiae NRRL 13137]
MSKRSYQESFSPGGSQPPEHIDNSHNGLLPINDLLSPTQDQSQSAASSKKPRNFIATVACETCRLKKDPMRRIPTKMWSVQVPRSRVRLQRTQIVQVRKFSSVLAPNCVLLTWRRRDHSLSLIMSTLHRMETKLESLPSSICNDLQSRPRPIPRTIDSPLDTSTPGRSSQGLNVRTSVPNPLAQGLTPDAIEHDDFEFDEHQKVTNSNGLVSISFSQHGVILWPGARDILPKRLLEAHERLGKNYVIDMEAKRPQLPMYICPYPPQAGDDWLESLPLAMIKGLSDAFFATLNPFTPIMDKNFYFAFTIWAAIESGFGYTIESCLVLNILALGCHAVQAHQEGNYPLPGTRSNRFEPPDWMAVIHEEPLGLRFFNEARRRIGFLMCDNDLQSCQFYMLSSVYYSQILRPMDAWAMIHRAATCCLQMMTNHDVNFDEWEGDMKSRVYWNCLMNETILVQELHLPPSGLARLEEFVPIPKFISFETVGLVPPRSASQELDDSFFQYHFLAQVAHRIILTRIRHSLYFYSDSGTFPLPAINAELHHQLEQWRLNLPPAIQFQDTHAATPANPNNATTTPITSPSTPISPLPLDPNRPLSPATAVSEAMLRGRFKIANFHIGRPYLYKALRIPASLSEDDLEQVRSGLQNAMDWPVVGGIFQNMKSCIPIKFAFCSQFFGQVLLFYCISHSPDPRLRSTLPPDWERWSQEMLQFLEDCAPFSPAVAKDLELLRLL